MVAVSAMVAPAAVAQEIPQYHYSGKLWSPFPLPVTKSVPVHNLGDGRTSLALGKGDKPLKTYAAAAPAWPSAGSATVSLTRAVAASASAAPAPKGSASIAGSATRDQHGASAAASASAHPSASAGSATTMRVVPVTGPVKVGALPVWLGPAASPAHGAHASVAAAEPLPTQVRVQVASHSQAVAAGANAMLLGFARADGSAAGQVQVVIDYADLARAFGGGYGSRLVMFAMPSCALTTPQIQACRTRTPLDFSNRADADQLVANLSLVSGSTVAPHSTGRAGAAPMDTSGSMTLVGVSSGTLGSQGDYSATSLNPSGTWQASGTGAFTYSYPIDVPSAVGGSAPSVSFDYNSQSVDGETSARNSQASWIGDGWDYQPGFIERSYRSCGSLLNSSGQRLLKGSGDECWGGDNATVSFGAHSGTLIPTTMASGVPGLVAQWKLSSDDGTVVQELSGAQNGLYQGIYYRVLTPDGSAAYFGSDHAPASTAINSSPQSGTPTDSSTNSAWGLPVLHPVSGDPCYSSTTGTASKCSANEGWRWNLDFTVSPNGFVQRYDYSTENNWYDLGGGQVAASNGSGTLAQYTRGGTLTQISYGYQLADELAGRTPAAAVVFASKQRCQTSPSFACSQAISTSNATNFPDVPYDLNCNQGNSTTLPPGSTSVPAGVCVTVSPTFWSTAHLDSVTTEVHVIDPTSKADKGLVPVDKYQLGQVYSAYGGTIDPVTGTTNDPADAGELQAVMWLQSIQHTGEADPYDGGSTAVTMNPVTFIGTEFDNRVDGGDAPELFRPRISAIVTETGEVISVDYYAPDCSRVNNTMPVSPDGDTMSCYQAYWTQPGAGFPIADWFNKSRVQTVVVSDATGGAGDTAGPKNSQGLGPYGSPDQVTNYSYGGAAWHRDDSAQTDDLYRTWDQFRGYRTVTVTTGTSPDPITQTTTTYLQGMDGDYLADGTQRSVKVSDTVGDNVVDSNWLAGTPLETDTYTAANGTIDAKSVVPTTDITQTASVAQTAWSDWNSTDYSGSAPTLSTLPPLTARRISDATTRSYSLLKSGSWRENQSVTDYDSQGRESTVDTTADVGGAAPQEQCATTDYAAPPSSDAMMLSYPDETVRESAACGSSSQTLLSDKKLYYVGDGTLGNLGTFGQLSGTGLVTGTQIATAFSAGTATAWQTTTAMMYDGAGRTTQTLTPDPTGVKASGLATTTSFTPAWSASGGNTNPTTMTSTNSQGWTTTSTLDPLRGQTMTNIDANKRATDVTYDALGRRTAVWLPGRLQASQSADMTFSYSIDPGATVTVGPKVATTITGAPSAVTTDTLREDNSYSQSITLYDGMLQPRQTQTTTADNSAGRLISDTFYDSHGWPLRTYAPYIDTTTSPSTTMAQVLAESQIPSENVTTYDGQGRALQNTLYTMGVAQWNTATSYPGADETDTTPPAGGPTTSTIVNALGQTTSSTVQNTNSQVQLSGGTVIPSGTSLMSDAVRLTMLASGDLSLTSLASGKQLWHTGTSSAGAYADFGTDGNLGVFSSSGTQLWSSNLTATTGSVLKLQNDANLVIYNSAGTSAWSTSTAGQAGQANATTSYTYTPAGQVNTIKDSAGNQWSYQYNLLGQPTSQSDPNTGTTSFNSYDVDGNLLQTTDARGQKLGYTYDWDNRPVAEYNLSQSASESSSNMLAAWAYDQTPSTADSPAPNANTLGYPTSSTRYVHSGTTTSSYTQQVTGYNSAYQPMGTRTTIPSADGFPAPAGTTQGASGTVSFESDATYTPNTGLLNSTSFGADGGLLPETIGYQYDLQGLLMSDGGTLTQSGGTQIGGAYVDNTNYSPLGQLTRTTYGVYGLQLSTTSAYDAATGRLTNETSDWQTSTASQIDSTDYRYDQAGDITATSDTESNGGAVTGTDTQCFNYDSFQRLTSAWSDTGGIRAAGVGGTGSCDDVSPTANATPSSPKADTVGGPAPYWQTYTYDLLGDRTGMVNHDTTGNAADNTTQTDAYTGADGTATATDPDQASSVTTSNPSLGSATQTIGYTDNSLISGGVDAGNTMTRASTTTGPLTSGVKTSAGGALCLADPANATTAGTQMILWGCGSGGQTFAIGTDGTVRVNGVCLDLSGTNVVLNPCSGAASQNWKTTTGGTLVNVSTGKCLADPSGNNTPGGAKQIIWTCGSGGQTYTPNSTGNAVLPGQTQTLTYDAEGRPATVTTPSGTTSQISSYLYDAEGNLLEETSGATTILYLFGSTEQLTKIGTGVTGQRSYTGPDGTVITRSTGGSTPGGTVVYQLSNAQGTATTTISSTTSTPTITRRYYDPYGNPRGTTPSTWPDLEGYLGKPTDATSGLDLLGARTYDPTQGRFTSPDPVFEAGDPNQMGGYTYAADNPSTGSDPSGLMFDGSDGAPTGCTPGLDMSMCSGPITVTDGSTKDVLAGFADQALNIASYVAPMGWAVRPIQHYALDKLESAAGVNKSNIGYSSGQREADVASLFLAPEDDPEVLFAEGEADVERALQSETAALEKANVEADGSGATAADHATSDSQEPAKSAPPKESTDPAHTQTAGESDTASSPSGKSKCSFSPDTPVLMANGTTEAIGKLKVGDKVESANPDTGKEEGGRTVQDVWINHDTDLLDVTVSDGHSHTAVVHTTANHPFWDDTTHTWVRADHLKPGDRLASTHGQHPTVVNTKTTPGAANRWNLTVQQLHTYYVLAGTTPILVHNTSGPNLCTVPGHDHVQSRVDDLTDAAGAGAGFRTMGGLHADVPGANGGLDFYAVGARADMTPTQFGELSDLGNTEFGFRVPQPARLVTRDNLWHAEVKLFNEVAGGLQLQPRFMVVSRPICPECENFLTQRGATLTSATTAQW
ncbi:polymorphic toxin-type HINT domain-containing protein [Streptacidiphilus sp. P02-A3a]|uniref:polymorphic toxin-type HINT domain-containing protein n=1 Tax=Streptacidiphilus sp. P02-A3a TaxID=2704468 RepID=UPI0015FA0AC1|nr:polymorphic toxin-type HINT domain-containing protein [Streptacidiphilus sp. P02-A3a]QMU68363.1 hypothetical protein GXP74_09110 [Streptacidiphilus sp. P02-A3a]